MIGMPGKTSTIGALLTMFLGTTTMMLRYFIKSVRIVP